MTEHRNDVSVIRRTLTEPGAWAVVGLSASTARTAYRIAAFVQGTLGHRIVPVHPRAETVHGERGYPDLASIPTGEQVRVVQCFVNSARVGAVVDAAIAEASRLGIRAVWLQLGVVDHDAARRAQEAGLDVVMDTCPSMEYPRL